MLLIKYLQRLVEKQFTLAMKVTSTKKNLFAFKADKVISWYLIYGDDLCFELLSVHIPVWGFL